MRAIVEKILADRIGKCTANFSAFEVEEEALSNLREYSLANSLYWALAEGHACEISSRRNAMDVCFPFPVIYLPPRPC